MPLLPIVGNPTPKLLPKVQILAELSQMDRARLLTGTRDPRDVVVNKHNSGHAKPAYKSPARASVAFVGGGVTSITFRPAKSF